MRILFRLRVYGLAFVRYFVKGGVPVVARLLGEQTALESTPCVSRMYVTVIRSVSSSTFPSVYVPVHLRHGLTLSNILSAERLSMRALFDNPLMIAF